jgi:hypothetical protein
MFRAAAKNARRITCGGSEMRKTRNTLLGTAALVAATASVGLAQVPLERNDVAFGRNRNQAADTLQAIRGFPTGTALANEWSQPFIQSVQFDNTDGFRHAHFGNLLGLNFGGFATGGEVYNLETRFTGGANPGAAQKIFDFATYNAANPAAPLTLSRINGLSVSPHNNRIAFTGSDTGAAYVIDYTAGATPGTGAGAAVTVGREAIVFGTGSTVGSAATAWTDNNTVLALAPTGDLQRLTVNNGTLSSANVATLAAPAGTSNFSSLAYEPTLSPYVWASIAKFDGTTTTNKVWALDPNNSFAVVDEVDLSGSIAAKSIRELAFDSRGNLFVSHFVNTTSTPAGESIHVILGAAANAGTIADNSSQPYYTQSPVLSAQFNGMDVAAALLDYKTAGVKVDIRNRSTVQQFFGASPLVEVRQKVQAGYNNGSWNGTGITSSNAAAQPGYAVGFGDAGDLGLVGGTFGGESVPGPAVLFRLTRFGDANLDGTVNLADFNRLAANFGATNSFWHRGDFNYDGNVNLSDFNLLAANFGQMATGTEVTPQDWANLAAAIPEPASVGLLGLGAVALVRRRRGA